MYSHQRDKKKICVCVTGWHFFEDTYRSISSRKDVDLFVISHRGPEHIPAWISHYVKPEHLFYEENVGYDWGCYAQFIKKKIWKLYDYIFLMHDDIKIIDIGFIEQSIKLLKHAYIIGNGRQKPDKNYPRTHAHSYAHARWKPQQNLKHGLIRGSFVAIKKSVLEQTGNLDVFWDIWKLTPSFGNWSMRAICAKWQTHFGPDAFAFLSENYCRSDYIIEEVRGGCLKREDGVKNKCRTIFINSLFRNYCRIVTRLHFMRHLMIARFLLALLQPWVYLVSGRCKDA